jgi:transketolase
VSGVPLDALPERAVRVRERILGLARGGGCFVGASLSAADLLLHLYSRVLHLAPASLHHPDRDVLLLSKGHDVPALYATLCELGYLAPALLESHLAVGSPVYWHPNRAVPGIEFHSGSLGHLLAVGLGVALDARLRRSPARVFVVMGDGELNEGSVWEAALVASAHRADNLVAVIDRNGMQANARTEDLLPLEPLAAKLRAFGWGVRETDGHDFSALDEAFRALPARDGRPTAVVARTVRGRGVPSLEDRVDRWFVRLTEAEVAALTRELHGQGPGRLGPGEVVR